MADDGAVPDPADLARTAARSGFRLDAATVAAVHAAVRDAEPVLARTRARPLGRVLDADPAYGERWLDP